MDTIIWFMLCLLASIGLVQVIQWIKCAGRQSRRQIWGYYVAPLPTDTGELEVKLRRCLDLRSWGQINGPLILFPERELDSEAKFICDKLLKGVSGVFVCYPGELESTIESFVRIRGEY